jgi:hypothetical protein
MARHSLRARARSLAGRMDVAAPPADLRIARYLLSLIAERKMPPHPSTARRLVLDILAGGRADMDPGTFAKLDHPAFMDSPPPVPAELRDYLASLQALADTDPSPWE